MYSAGGITKGLTLTKIIGGLSKTLQIANQVIPLYQKAKPMINNARSMMGILKEFKKSSPKTLPTTDTTIVNSKKVVTNTTKKEAEPTSPTFFL